MDGCGDFHAPEPAWRSVSVWHFGSGNSLALPARVVMTFPRICASLVCAQVVQAQWASIAPVIVLVPFSVTQFGGFGVTGLADVRHCRSRNVRCAARVGFANGIKCAHVQVTVHASNHAGFVAPRLVARVFLTQTAFHGRGQNGAQTQPALVCVAHATPRAVTGRARLHAARENARVQHTHFAKSNGFPVTHGTLVFGTKQTARSGWASTLTVSTRVYLTPSQRVLTHRIDATPMLARVILTELPFLQHGGSTIWHATTMAHACQAFLIAHA